MPELTPNQKELKAQEEALNFQNDESTAKTSKKPFAIVALSVLGIVYGDIGTSPIYALQQAFIGKDPLPVTPDNVLGLLSLILWALILIISLKYMTFVLRADNHGEGGTFALLGLLRPKEGEPKPRRMALLLLGVAGAAMLFGAAIITPAISVLSAVQGLEIIGPQLKSFVIPITIGILFALFAIQRRGTAVVGIIFGPFMLLWFSFLAISGIISIIRYPIVLMAINPWQAVIFFQDNGLTGFLVLYAVFLVTTGGEALFADLGHFSLKPIRLVWFFFVLPSLLLNYFGQGATLLLEPKSVVNPFFHLVPTWGLIPLVIITTFATIIASQAAITGVFSLTRQAIQLDWMPPFQVRQTSADAHGQVYLPAINWAMMVAVIGLVLIFKTSENLAAAYGVAVNATMAITTILMFTIARKVWDWNLLKSLGFLIGFLIIELTFLASNAVKIPDGGWLPLLIALLLFTLMTTWRRGSTLLMEQFNNISSTIASFIGKVTAEKVLRIPQTGVFLTERLIHTPLALQKLVHHTGVLYEQVLLVTVLIEEVPTVAQSERIEITDFDTGFYQVVLHYGFMQGINIPSELAQIKEHNLNLDTSKIQYIIGHVEIVPGRKLKGMASWRDSLFEYMARNTQDITATYQLPDKQTMIIGLKAGI
jgi:KUP system potassium uptake protein